MSNVDCERERDGSPALGVTQAVSRAGFGSTVKTLDDRRREVRELLERTNEMLARKRAGLIQGWLKGYFDIFVVGFHIDNPKLGIVLECACEGQEGGSPARVEMADHCEHAGHVHDDQTLVLPRYVEIVECDQNGIIAASPRFQIFDDRPISLGEPLYLLAARVLADFPNIRVVSYYDYANAPNNHMPTQPDWRISRTTFEEFARAVAALPTALSN